MPLTKNQVLEKKKIRIEEVFIPEWGDTVFVKELSAAERDAYESSLIRLDAKGNLQGHNLVNIRARLAAFAICDQDGVRLFSDKEAAELGNLSGAALDRVFEVAQRLSGITAADLQELEKNSVSGPFVDSFSS